MRGSKLGSPPPLERRADLNRLTQVREYRLITPLFGGGVRPGEADPLTPVRGTTVRGQLRFWWRATRGGHYGGDLARMKVAEDLLWGAASRKEGAGPSLVDVQIDIVDEGRAELPFEVTQNPRSGRYQVRSRPSVAPGYAAFPLQPNQDELRNWDPERHQVKPVRVNIQFRLTVCIPQYWEDHAKEHFAGSPLDEIVAGLWAWETFGGVGARTRRGFGALQLLSVEGAETDSPTQVTAVAAADWVAKGLARHVVAGRWPDDVPHLDRTIPLRITRARRDPVEAWRGLVDQLKAFRQQRRLNRLVENGRTITRPGRNHWPEQDEVRRLTRRRSPRHRDVVSNVRKFPRAAFGLPLIIQYKRDDQRDGDPDGNNTVVGRLQDGTKLDRLASPLILRALIVADGAVGLAAVLRGVRMPDQLVLEYRGGREDVAWQLTPAEAAEITSPAGQAILGGATDVLEAFLNSLER